MTSRELVRRAIRFQRPERLPFTGSMGETDFSGDTVAIFPDIPCKWWLGGGGEDEWGCQWEVEPGTKDMGQVKNIRIPDLNDLSALQMPNAADPARYRGWPEILARAEAENKYVVCCNGPLLFERAHFLHGFENTLVDIACEPELVIAFLRRLAEYHFATIRHIQQNFPGRIHGYRTTDDWGTQQAAIISPASFAQVFQPVYRDLFAAVHAAGMDAWLHSCGCIHAILPLLIEAGLDVVNVMQTNAFPQAKLADFRGRISFEICADAQTTLPTGEPEAIQREIAALLASCAAPDGGVIEVKLDRMYFDADGVTPATGELCHATYRRLDPYRH